VGRGAPTIVEGGCFAADPQVRSPAMESPTCPGAVEPERSSFVESSGLRIHCLEWGDPAADPIVLCHGMWDHARSFATLAPLLAERYRVVAIDSRGHGESDWADGYSWPCDIADIVRVARSLGRPVYLVGHSKGGGQATDATRAAPDLVRKVVNIDGFGPPPFTPEDEPSPQQCRMFLDLRRRAAERDHWRPYPTLDHLIKRRQQQNPRLTGEWLRYFVFHAARQVEGGWAWRADPLMAHGFGPWRPEWIGVSYRGLTAPLLAITGSERDTWGPLPESILAERLSNVRNLERLRIAGAGHFVHMERPRETARAILDFLAS
jgi:pimeloyl-ACP methyl ester carboxylesterase